MSSELLTSLVELGFESAKAERALKETQNRSVDAALDWLEKYGDNPPEEEKDEDVSMKEEGVHKTVPTSKNGEGPIMAKGLKCTECDKFFKNNALASYHSEKSGHVNFDEMEYEDKPLTEQEKQERLDRLRDQLKERQLAKQKIEIAENKANEAIRRKGGKDMVTIKEELKKKEMEKEIAQRKKDKLDDERAKARARAAIAEDKAERIRKAAFEKSKRTGLPPPPDPPMVAKPPAKKSTSANSSSTKEYSEGRFQLRLPSPEGSVIVLILDADRNLNDLALALINHDEFNNHAQLGSNSIRFSTTYPRKVFSVDEMNKSIKVLGLLPSVALAVSYV
ncbi:hypothetical protein PSTG_15636 [Puccinia striiformis f. sp. tritici PST-78]|uniref:UBA domain-containing protein n=1 Tax=Puccinia striiformis f. sp. tritici PST-78 TaxID=1165861 RepID=A0A0L0UVG9_9BASI|nr:hypothetical protein PSTG_15636 [Puccinia striiformis f. sp. tritici PST-78]